MIQRDKFGVFFPCTHCGEEVPKAIGELLAHPEAKCPNCDRMVNLRSPDWQFSFREIVRDLQKIIEPR